MKMRKDWHLLISQPKYDIVLPIIPKGYNGAGEPVYPSAGPFRIPTKRREVVGII
jgi:hypothetical protein